MTTALDTHDLKSRFGGKLLHPNDQGYEAARKVFNAMIDRRPGLIAQCASPEDVVLMVNFARERRLLLSVRCAGHNVAGFAVCDEGVVIDLSLMKHIEVDATAGSVRVEAGTTWGEVTDALQPHGLAATGGYVSVTGVSGLTLGGGLGWLARKHGLAIDNLLSAEVVLADGRRVNASAGENEDLYWALRGGGGNFGIVTSFTFQAHPAGIVLGGIVVHPFAIATSVLRHWREFEKPHPRSSRKVQCCFTLGMIPPYLRRCAGRRLSPRAAFTPARPKRARKLWLRSAPLGHPLRTCSSQCRTAPPNAWQIFFGLQACSTTGSRAF